MSKPSLADVIPRKWISMHPDSSSLMTYLEYCLQILWVSTEWRTWAVSTLQSVCICTVHRTATVMCLMRWRDTAH